MKLRYKLLIALVLSGLVVTHYYRVLMRAVDQHVQWDKEERGR